MHNVAQAWVVLDLTGSAIAVGAVTVAQAVPYLGLSLLAGPLAERFRKRRFLMALQAAAAVQAGVLATLVLSGHVQIWQIYVLAVVHGVLNAIDNPNRQAFVNELVATNEIQSAVGLNSSVHNLARIVGPAIGGLIIAAWGSGWCFVLNAGAFSVAFVAFLAIDESALRPSIVAAVGRLDAQIVAGLRYVIGDRDLLVMLVLLGVMATIGYNWQVALPLLARYTFGTGAIGFGALNAALGAGSVIGGLLVAWRQALQLTYLCLVAAGFSLLLASIAFAPHYLIAMPLLLAAGCCSVLFSAGVQAIVQLRSLPEYRGRVLGLFFLLWGGGVVPGAALTAGMAAYLDIRAALAIKRDSLFSECQHRMAALALEAADSSCRQPSATLVSVALWHVVSPDRNIVRCRVLT
jgi:MFS family permease